MRASLSQAIVAVADLSIAEGVALKVRVEKARTLARRHSQLASVPTPPPG